MSDRKLLAGNLVATIVGSESRPIFGYDLLLLISSDLLPGIRLHGPFWKQCLRFLPFSRNLEEDRVSINEQVILSRFASDIVKPMMTGQ